MKVATAQFEHRSGDIEYNLNRVLALTMEAANSGCELVAFPECCLTGYWYLRNLDRAALVALAEELAGQAVLERVGETARKHRISIGVGYVEFDQQIGKLFNAYSLIGPDGELARHRKIHCFVSPHLDSGDNFTVFELPNGRLCGILTCYDNNIIENVRATALAGAEILIAPHQTGGCNSGSPHAMGLVDAEVWNNRREVPDAIETELKGDKGRGWLMRWLPARAHDNGLFLIFSNGIGWDDDEIRTGNSMVIDPYGRIVRETYYAGDALVTAVLDFSIQKSSTGRRWLRARRPELYGSLITEVENRESTREVRFEHLQQKQV